MNSRLQTAYTLRFLRLSLGSSALIALMSRLKRASAFAVLLAAGLAAWAATRPAEIAFARHMIDPGAYETCAVADINRDGHPDIVSGENWYEGPGWIQHHFRSIEYYRNATEDLSDLVLDVNADGYPDTVSSASHG